VRENHAELVVQPVEEFARIFSCHCLPLFCQGRFVEAHFSAPYATALGLFGCFVPSGSRHSVSTKIRMLPPAVRKYSTLFAAIQL